MHDRKKKPSPKLSHFEKWLLSMIVDGDATYNLQIFQNQGKIHQLQFVFPRRNTVKTDNEDELDDLRRYFKKLSSHHENKLVNQQHTMTFPIPVERASFSIMKELMNIRGIATEYSLAKHTIDMLLMATIPSKAGTIESVTIFTHAANELFALIKKYSAIDKIKTLQQLMHDCRIFYLQITAAIDNRKESSAHLAPVIKLIRDVQKEILKSRYREDYKYNDFLCRELVMHLSETASYLKSKTGNDLPERNPLSQDKIHLFAKNLERLIKVIRPFNQEELLKLSDEISQLFFDSTISHHPIDFQRSSEQMFARIELIRKVTAIYARELDMVDIANEILSPLKAQLALRLVEAIKISLQENKEFPNDILLNELKKYNTMVNTLGDCFDHQPSQNMIKRIMSEYLTATSLDKTAEYQQIHAQFKENVHLILRHLNTFRTIDLPYSIPQEVITRFIEDEFNQVNILTLNPDQFYKDTDTKFQEIMLLGQLNSLIKNGLKTFSGSKIFYLINDLSLSIELAFLRIENDPSRSITEYTRQFLNTIKENAELISLLKSAKNKSMFSVKSKPDHFLNNFGALKDQLELLVNVIPQPTPLR